MAAPIAAVLLVTGGTVLLAVMVRTYVLRVCSGELALFLDEVLELCILHPLVI